MASPFFLAKLSVAGNPTRRRNIYCSCGCGVGDGMLAMLYECERRDLGTAGNLKLETETMQGTPLFPC